MPFPSQLKFNWNFVFLQFHSGLWYSHKSLHIVWQHICCAICMNLWWPVNLNLDESKVKFPSQLNCAGKIIAELGPWHWPGARSHAVINVISTASRKTHYLVLGCQNLFTIHPHYLREPHLMLRYSQAHTTYRETNEAVPLRHRSGDCSPDTSYVIFLNNCPGALMLSLWLNIPGLGSEVADALDTNLIEHYQWLVGRLHSYWFLSTGIDCIIVKHWWESGFPGTLRTIPSGS